MKMKKQAKKKQARHPAGRPIARRAARRTAARAKGAARGRSAPGGKRAAGGKRPGKMLLSDAGIASATARAQASVRTELGNKSFLADRMTEQALAEAEEIGMLLEEGDTSEEDSSEAAEENAWFLKPQPVGPPRPRTRPAPGIGTSRAPRAGSAKTRSASASPSPLPPEAAHLFPRNLTLAYPVAVKAKGVWIDDAQGKRYLDACGGAVVCSIGHGVTEIADAMAAQARRLAFAHSSQFVTREAMALSAKIAALAPGDMKETGRVYLTSGGSEAVETALKLARQYHVERGRPEKHKIVGRWQSYHGSTLGALSVTGNVARRDLYAPMLSPSPHIVPCFCYRCPLGLEFPSCRVACVDDLDRVIREEGPDSVAAFIAEPIVGATLGAAPAVPGYFERVREICDRHDVLFIADEVMTGIGRTGRNFGIEHFEAMPDLVVTGKGLSAGYAPLGAVIARGPVVEAIRAGRGFFEHGFTYSANPLSAAVGIAVLDYIARHDLVRRAAETGRRLGERLAALAKRRPVVGQVRGAGMLWGIELVRSRATREPFPPKVRAARWLYEIALEEGLVLYPGTGTREGKDGDHAIIAPPFNITPKELDTLLERLDRSLQRLTTSIAA
jgi:adenosylmethionine-8-amino-7-oxononanoate aminotransferase